MSNAPKFSRRERLIATSDDGRIELTEQALSRVIGGARKGAPPPEFLKITFKEALVS